MSRQALGYAQRLLQPPPEKPDHDLAHDAACAWADRGRERESP